MTNIRPRKIAHKGRVEAASYLFDGDLIGTAVLGAMLALMPVVVPQGSWEHIHITGIRAGIDVGVGAGAGWVAGGVGAGAGLALGYLLNKIHPS